MDEVKDYKPMHLAAGKLAAAAQLILTANLYNLGERAAKLKAALEAYDDVGYQTFTN